MEKLRKLKAKLQRRIASDVADAKDLMKPNISATPEVMVADVAATSPPEPFEVIRRVTLTRSPTEGFGLVLQGGVAINNDRSRSVAPVTVARIPEGKPAAQCGCIRSGDQLISVNGEPLEGKTLQSVTVLLKMAGARVVLELQFLQDPEDPPRPWPHRLVSLARPPGGGGFGIVIQQVIRRDAQGNPNPNAGVYVSRLRPGSAAAESGAVSVGDRILAVDGESAIALSIADVEELLISAGDSTELMLSLPGGGTPLAPGQTQVVSLVKSKGGGLGMKVGQTITGSNDAPISVTKLHNGGPASKSGLIALGDLLVSVHGINIAGKSLEEVTTLLTRPGTTVTLVFGAAKPPPSPKDDMWAKVDCSAVTATADTEPTSPVRPYEYADGPVPDHLRFTITISVTQRGGLGLKLSGGDESGCVVVSGLTEGLAAAESGAVEIGDRVLSINGVAIDGQSLTVRPPSPSINPSFTCRCVP